jgi:hypothetical protein
VETVALLLVAVLLPTAAGYSYLGARRLHAAYVARRAPLPAAQPIDRIRADLRRLHDLLDETENAPSGIPAKNQRCQATRAAYLDALTAACQQLQVPVPAGRPVPRAEIYRVEADLRRLGLDVRPVG